MQITHRYVSSDNNKPLPSKGSSRRPPDPASGSTARHGTPRTHPLLRRRRTDPHVWRPFVTGDTGRDPRPRACPAAPLPAPRPAAPRSPATPRETEVGKGRTQLMALHGQQGGGLRGATRHPPGRGLPCRYPGGGRGCPSILWRRPRQRLTHGAGSDAAHHSGGAPGRGGSLSSE